MPAFPVLGGRRTGRAVDAGPPPKIEPQARPVAAKPTEGSSDWARPRRFGAYPTLGRRVRLRGISPLVVGVFALMIAALVLFLLPGFLSGLGGAANQSVRPSGSALASLAAATPRPAPTPKSYTVKKGDVLGTIAKSSGLTVAQIVCFNGLKNANVLSIGQVLLLPPVDYTCPPKGGGVTPKPSASPR
jgi:hypothetical protein